MAPKIILIREGLIAKRLYAYEDSASETICLQGVIQGVFEIGNRFWAHKNWRPNFDKVT